MKTKPTKGEKEGEKEKEKEKESGGGIFCCYCEKSVGGDCVGPPTRIVQYLWEEVFNILYIFVFDI